MTVRLACVNLKGGVGKTAIAVNLAAYAARHEIRTLLVDLDPQTNATFSCLTVDAWQEHADANGSVADLLGARKHASAEDRKIEASDVIVPNALDGVDLIPSHLDLFTVDLDLAGATARETKLKRALRPIIDDYDLVVCDCPPNLTIPTQNALAFCSHFVVPVSPDYLSGVGVGILLRRIEDLALELDNELEHAGIVLSRIGRTARHREQTAAAIRERFGNLVLDSEIKERVAVSEATQAQESIYARGDQAAIAEFESMSVELLGVLGLKP